MISGGIYRSSNQMQEGRDRKNEKVVEQNRNRRDRVENSRGLFRHIRIPAPDFAARGAESWVVSG